MKKRGIKVGVLIGAALVLFAIVLVAGFSTPKDTAVMRINGAPVFEEEFLLLLRQNEAQYENQLREEYGIPGEQSVLEYLGGDESEYSRLLFEENVAFITGCRVEQALAQEFGLASEFTYQGFLDALEAENQSRAEKIAKGEVVYGLQRFSAEQYYSYYMSNLAQRLQHELPQELFAVSDGDVDAYYDKLNTYAGVDGETIRYTLYDVTAAQTLPAETQSWLYNQIAATMEENTYFDVAVDNITCRAEKHGFTPNELRNFVRQDFNSEFLLGLAPGEVCGPFSLGDSIYIAQYNGFEKAETLQDNDRAVFKNMLRKEAYGNLIALKIEQADIKVTQNVIIEEEER